MRRNFLLKGENTKKEKAVKIKINRPVTKQSKRKYPEPEKEPVFDQK